ncbi:MAG: class I SAM-dependent methyltransferase, partial [Acidobacteria bacterium]|nr:class I SAM-dependent methyltransferase [Acidobacteriota bacterium]
MNTGTLLALAIALVALACCSAVLLAYGRHSRRQLEARLKRLDSQLGELSAKVALQEPSFSLPLPWTSWTLSASCLLRIRESFAKRTIRTVVECGAGISTLHLARFLAPGGGRLVSLEDDEVWAAAVRRMVEKEGLAEIVTVLHRPLVEHRVLGHSVRWYDVRSPRDLGLDTIDLILV